MNWRPQTYSYSLRVRSTKSRFGSPSFDSGTPMAFCSSFGSNPYTWFTASSMHTIHGTDGYIFTQSSFSHRYPSGTRSGTRSRIRRRHSSRPLTDVHTWSFETPPRTTRRILWRIVAGADTGDRLGSNTIRHSNSPSRFADGARSSCTSSNLCIFGRPLARPIHRIAGRMTRRTRGGRDLRKLLYSLCVVAAASSCVSSVRSACWSIAFSHASW